MDSFLHDPGLFWATVLLTLVTAWYSYATYKMARTMALDFEIRTVPKLAFKAVKVIPDGWNSLKIEQEIVNTGLGTLNLEWAELEWWAYDESAMRHKVMTTILVPVILTPGQAVAFSFVIPKSDLERYFQNSIDSAEEVITGLIRYIHNGPDGKERSQKYNLPEPGSTSLAALIPSLRTSDKGLGPAAP